MTFTSLLPVRTGLDLRSYLTGLFFGVLSQISLRNLEQELRRRKRPVGTSWRLDETYINVRGKGIEVMHIINKGQLVHDREQAHPPAEQFYALAA